MAMRPVSFLAQAAAQRQQTRENEKQRDFQKDQALRDFGMNIGQALVGSLANFGAQAGAQAIAFNREEPYKQLEANVNPMPGLMPKIGGASSALKAPPPAAPPKLPGFAGTGDDYDAGPGPGDTAAMLRQAAIARTATPVARPAPEPPAPAPAPARPVRGTIAGAVQKMAPPAARPEYAGALPGPVPAPVPPRAPAARPRGMEGGSPMAGRESEIASAPPASAPMSVMGALEQAGRGLTAPAAPSPAPAPGSVIESVSMSSSGTANPEARSWAQQEMRQIIQKHLGPPMEYTNADGSPADPQDAAFRRAYDQKADNARLDMLVKMGLVDAEDMKAEAYRIKSLKEGRASETTANSDREYKISQATKNVGEGAKAYTGEYDTKRNRIKHDAPGELHVRQSEGQFPLVSMGPDRPLPSGGGGGGGTPRVTVQFPDATEVWAQGYSETKNARGQNLQEAVVVPEEYLALVDKNLKKYRYIERADAPAIKKALKAGDWQTAQALFKPANAKYAKGYAAQTEAVTPPTTLVARADAAQDELDREVDAGLGNNVERETAVADAKAKLLAARQTLTPKDVGLTVRNTANFGYLIDDETSVDDLDVAKVLEMVRTGGSPEKLPEGEGAKAVYNNAKRVLGERKAAALDAIAPFRSSYIKGGGTADEFDRLVLPQPKAAPGPSTPSPGQPPPPPGRQSSLDDLFDQIEAKPWDAAKKRRVFRDMAQKAGLA